jgi:hypothetical protein
LRVQYLNLARSHDAATAYFKTRNLFDAPTVEIRRSVVLSIRKFFFAATRPDQREAIAATKGSPVDHFYL